MANPNLLLATTVTQDILAEAQLSSGNNDFTVPSGKSWMIKSFSMTNTSGSAVSVTVSAIKTGGTARVVIPVQTVDAGVGVVVDPTVLALLPEAATLRVNASAGSAINLFVTGVVSA
jgi:hypothetical protein